MLLYEYVKALSRSETKSDMTRARHILVALDNSCITAMASVRRRCQQDHGYIGSAASMWR